LLHCEEGGGGGGEGGVGVTRTHRREERSEHHENIMQSKVKQRKMKNKNNFLNASLKKMRNVFFFLEIVTIAIF